MKSRSVQSICCRKSKCLPAHVGLLGKQASAAGLEPMASPRHRRNGGILKN